MRYFPYPEFRSGQDLIYNTIRDADQAVLINAPTGIGKTITSLSALLTLKGSKNRIVVVVKTIMQIEPMLREWAKIREHENNELFILPLIGRERICGKQCLKDHNDLELKDGDRKYSKNHLRNLNGIFLEYIEDGSTKPDQEMSRVNTMISYLSDISQKQKSCPKFLMDAMLEHTDIVVTTYPFLYDDLFSSLLFKMRCRIENILLLVDEAHNLIRQQTYKISIADLTKIEKEYGQLPISQSIRDTVSDWDNEMEKLPDQKCRETLTLLQDLDLKEEHINLIESMIEFLQNRKSGEIRINHQAIFILDYLPSRHLSKFANARLQIYQSATFHELDPVIKLFGLPKDCVTVNLIDPHGIPPNQLRLWMDNSTSQSRYRNAFNIANMAKLIKYVHIYSPRHSLVLCPSYDFIEKLRENFIDEAIIVEEAETQTSDITEKILSSTIPKIILANQRGKIFEGVEWTYNKHSLISVVVLAGIGTYAPDVDPEVEQWKRNLLRHLGEQDRENILYNFPLHTSALQGFGRAIRGKNDKGALVVLDYRADDYLVAALNLSRVNMDGLEDRMTSFFQNYYELWQLNHPSFHGKMLPEVLLQNPDE